MCLKVRCWATQPLWGVWFYYSVCVWITWPCVWTEMDFWSVYSSRKQLLWVQHKFLLRANNAEACCGGMIIEWNRDWIGSSCHCQTHRQVDDSMPQAPRVRLARKKQHVWLALGFDFAFKLSSSRELRTTHQHFFIQHKPHVLVEAKMEAFIHTHIYTLSKNKGGNSNPFSFN